MTEQDIAAAPEAEKEVIPELTTQQLLDEVSKGHRALKVYEKGVQILHGLVVLEQNIKEKTASNEKLKAAESEWIEKRQKAAAEADAAVQRGNDAMEAAAAEAKRTTEEARGTAQRITTEAKVQANKLISEAKEEANTHTLKSVALQGANAEADGNLKRANAELSAIKEAIAQHKEAIKKFVG